MCIAVIVDTYTTNVEINPRTGREWEHGELGEYMMLNPGCNVLLRPPAEQGDEVFVSDALNVIAANRAGDLITQTLPYRVVGQDVRWNRVTTVTDAGKRTLPGAIRDFMMRPTIEHALGVKGAVPEYFAREMAVEDADVRRAKLDISLAQFLRSHFHMTIQMDIIPGSRRDEIFQRLPGWHVVGDHLEFGDDAGDVEGGFG